MTMTREAALAAVIEPKAHADTPRLNAAYEWLRKNEPIALTQPEGFGSRIFQGGTDSSTLAVHNTVVRPARISTRPAAAPK